MDGGCGWAGRPAMVACVGCCLLVSHEVVEKSLGEVMGGLPRGDAVPPIHMAAVLGMVAGVTFAPDEHPTTTPNTPLWSHSCIQRHVDCLCRMVCISKLVVKATPVWHTHQHDDTRSSSTRSSCPCRKHNCIRAAAHNQHTVLSLSHKTAGRWYFTTILRFTTCCHY